MVEVIVQSDAVAANGSRIGEGAAPAYIQDTPLTHKTTAKIPTVGVASPPSNAAPLAPATAGQMANNASTTTPTVPDVGILDHCPNEVAPGDTFQVVIGVINRGQTEEYPVVDFPIPINTKFISAAAGNSQVQNPVNPNDHLVAILASNNEKVVLSGQNANGMRPETGGALTVTLQATGPVGSDINISDVGLVVPYMGAAFAPPNVVHIKASPSIGISCQIAGAPMTKYIVKGADLFMVYLNAAKDKVMVLGAPSIVAQGGGNIVAQGGGNIVAQGGGNLIVTGDSSLILIGSTTAAGIVAQGGGNIILGEKCTIVGQGGGNIVAQGGGNIVGQGGGNIVAQGGLNLEVYENLVNTNGSNFYAAGGGKIVTSGGLNFNSLPGTTLKFITKGGNIMGTGANGSSFRLSP